MSLMAKPWPDIRGLERRTRTLPATNISAEFILNSVALAENSQYVPEVDRFVPLPEAQRYEDAILALWKDSSAEKEKLFASMELLRQKSRTKETIKSEVELREFTWQQVIAEVQAASETYRSEGWRIKKIFQKMCDNAGIFENWLSLLPNGDYGASISGAFVMVVRAARGMSDVQKSIYETLASIPDTLSHASAYVEIYKAHSSEALVEKTAALCKTILTTLQLIIQFFLKSSFKRGAAAMFKGNAYEQELMESVQNMKCQALNLREEANLCLQKRIAEMDRKSDLRASKEQIRHQLAKEELLLAIDSSTEITAQKVCTYLLRQLQASPEFSVRTGGANLPIKSSLWTAEEETLRSDMFAPNREGVTSEDLLDILDYDDDFHRNDVEDCLTLGYTHTDAAQARATWVLQSSELGEFLAGKAESKLFLINGNYEATQFISSLSFVCAKISDLVSVSNQVMLITYFCSRHTDELRDIRANAKGLIANLVGQLVSQVKRRRYINFKLDLSSVTNEDCYAIQEEDLNALFNLFRTVIMQLPKGTVIFCLVDGISAYENSDRKGDTIDLMQKLARLIRKSTRIVFKLMVTCPGRSTYADRWGVAFNGKEAQMLQVPEDL